MARIMTLSNLTLAVAAQLLLVNRFLPSSFVPHVPFIGVSTTIIVSNYLVLFAWRALIDPYFIHPLRNFPAPKITVITT
jgi:hypothetical protein